jgi:hypothetical protein
MIRPKATFMNRRSGSKRKGVLALNGPVSVTIVRSHNTACRASQVNRRSWIWRYLANNMCHQSVRDRVKPSRPMVTGAQYHSKRDKANPSRALVAGQRNHRERDRVEPNFPNWRAVPQREGKRETRMPISKERKVANGPCWFFGTRACARKSCNEDHRVMTLGEIAAIPKEWCDRNLPGNIGGARNPHHRAVKTVGRRT